MYPNITKDKADVYKIGSIFFDFPKYTPTLVRDK